MNTKIRIRNATSVASISQGGVTANLTEDYQYPPRVEIIPTQNNSYAPMEVGIEVKLLGFHTDPQNVWVWGDYGDPGGFAVELPEHVKMLGSLVNPEFINMNRVRGRFCGHVYDEPNKSHTITVHAMDIDGQVYTGTYDINTTDPWDHFEKHLFIDPDGDFVDENGVDREAAGDECLTSFPFQWEPRHGGRTDTWVHLRSGKNIPVDGGPGAETTVYGWGDQIYPNAYKAKNVFISEFGDPNLSKPVMDKGFVPVDPAPGRITIWGVVCDPGPLKYDSLTEWGGEDYNGNLFAASGSAKTLIYNCYNDGGRQGFGLSGLGSIDEPLSPSKSIDQCAFIAGGAGINFSDFGMSGGGVRQIVIGAFIARDIECFQGMNGPNYGVAKPRRYPDDPALYTNVHGAFRSYSVTFQGYMVVSLCQMDSHSSWTSAGSNPGYQPVIRVFSNGEERMPRGCINGNIFEGAGNVLVFNGLGQPCDGGFTIENNLMVCSQRSASHGSVIGGLLSGTVIRNNISIRSNVSYGGVGDMVRMEYPSKDDFPESWGVTPIRFYGNTDLVWDEQSIHDREWHKYRRGQFIHYDPSTNYAGNVPDVVDFEVHDNFKYWPNIPEPEVEGFAGFAPLAYVARYAGNKWQDKFDDREGQMTMDRSLEFPPFLPHDGEDQQTIAAPLCDIPADGPNPLRWDFFYRDRGDNTVKGAFNPDTAPNTDSGPVFRMSPYLKLTSNGTVRYHSGSVAGGSASLVDITRNGNTIASGSNGDPDVGEVSHGASDGERSELVMTVSVSDGSTQEVRLPFVHPS